METWIVRGRGIYIKTDPGGFAVVKDRSCSEENMQLIADSMNAYPRYNFMTKELVGLLKEDPAVVKKEVARILQTIGILPPTPPNVGTTAVKPLG
jgi:hypothetical protein